MLRSCLRTIHGIIDRNEVNRNSARTNANPAGGTRWRSTGWGQGEQLCGRDVEGSWTPGWAGSSNASWQQGRPTASWVVATEVQSVGGGK